MPKIYFDKNSILIDASKPHPYGTQYKISKGIEMWDKEPVEVMKIQMVYDGRVLGRKTPSFPVNTDDFERCITAFNELKD